MMLVKGITTIARRKPWSRACARANSIESGVLPPPVGTVSRNAPRARFAASAHARVTRAALHRVPVSAVRVKRPMMRLHDHRKSVIPAPGSMRRPADRVRRPLRLLVARLRALTQVFLELRLEFPKIGPQPCQSPSLGSECSAELRSQPCGTFAVFK